MPIHYRAERLLVEDLVVVIQSHLEAPVDVVGGEPQELRGGRHELGVEAEVVVVRIHPD